MLWTHKGVFIYAFIDISEHFSSSLTRSGRGQQATYVTGSPLIGPLNIQRLGNGPDNLIKPVIGIIYFILPCNQQKAHYRRRDLPGFDFD
jgi:hypothetical protein